MIEGLRAAPWFMEMLRRDQIEIGDCKNCMKTNPQLVRQHQGCGYEPPLKERVHLTVWQPPSGDAGYSGPEFQTCAGYTANLPEVIEASLARAHWSKGNGACLGRLSPSFLNAILILEGQYSSLQSWLMTPAADGGGGK